MNTIILADQGKGKTKKAIEIANGEFIHIVMCPKNTLRSAFVVPQNTKYVIIEEIPSATLLKHLLKKSYYINHKIKRLKKQPTLILTSTSIWLSDLTDVTNCIIIVL